MRHAESAQPLLLLLDCHSSHCNMDIITMAPDNGVIIFTLVLHTTHEMEPLHIAVFEPFKGKWQKNLSLLDLKILVGLLSLK